MDVSRAACPANRPLARALLPPPGLHGPGLALARLAWVLLVGVTAAFYAAGMPAAVRVLGVPCSGQGACNNFRLYAQDVQVLELAGLSLQTYATYGALLSVVTLVPIYGAAAVLFWRRSGTWMAIFMSFVLILLGPTAFSNVTGPLVSERPAWGWVVGVLLALGYWTSFTTYYLFPNGRFVPRWAWLMALAIGVFSVLHAFPVLLFGLGFPAAWFGSLTALALLMMFAAGLAAQVYRYRAVSGPLEGSRPNGSCCPPRPAERSTSCSYRWSRWSSPWPSSVTGCGTWTCSSAAH